MSGPTELNETVTGTLKGDVTWSISKLEQMIEIRYDTFDDQATYVNCQVGGLSSFGKANRGGCTFLTIGAHCP